MSPEQCDQFWTALGSITNRCSGKEPFLGEEHVQRRTLEIRA